MPSAKDPRTCRACGGAMEAGTALDAGVSQVMRLPAFRPPIWVPGRPKKALGGTLAVPSVLYHRGYGIETWRCGGCGLLESFAVEKLKR